MTDLVELRQTLIELQERQEKERLAFESSKKQVLEQIANASRDYNLALAGVDLDKVKLAESILYVEGNYDGNYKDLVQAMQDAIDWCAAIIPCEGRRLSLDDEYFGTKNYAHWVHQGHNGPYCTGPRHGTIVFEIGLRRDHRGKGLDNTQRDACIYYLEMVRAGKIKTGRE